MADVVTSQTIVDTAGTKTVMKFTNISDGSGETLVTKMDASALNFMTEDANRVLAKIYWSVNTTNGKSGVELLFAGSGDNAANATIGFFSGRGKYGLRPDQLKFGDDKQILLTTDSNVDSYLLITEFRRNN